MMGHSAQDIRCRTQDIDQYFFTFHRLLFKYDQISRKTAD